MEYGFGIRYNFEDSDHPRYIAVEGPIGAGKTTLAKHLAASFGYETLLEDAEKNPFLERFYRDQQKTALPTQLFFLFQRAQQLESMRQNDLFEPVRVADFIIEKDPLFAEVTLDKDELAIYQQVYNQLKLEAPVPDLVIYLQASVDTLLERINSRGVDAERNIGADYLSRLNEAYTRFFLYYDKAPLLIINSSDIDLVSNPEHYQNLVDYLLSIKSGRHFYNPESML